MKAMECCIGCLKGLAEKTVKLSGGDNVVLSDCYRTIEELSDKGCVPTVISNRLLRYIRDTTGVNDPYAPLKMKEFEEAKKAIALLKDRLPGSLEGVVKLSALGNSLDFFIGDGYGFDAEGLTFYGDIDKIEEEIYIRSKDVLILGDNIGDFVFDIPLIEFLESREKRVYYAVKGHPVLNDLSMPDAIRFGFVKMFDNIISTGIAEVGMRREEMKGKARQLWEEDAVVIAKGMANYETISERPAERPVIHIMKVKCPAVSKAAQREIGTYVALFNA